MSKNRFSDALPYVGGTLKKLLFFKAEKRGHYARTKTADGLELVEHFRRKHFRRTHYGHRRRDG